MFDDDDDDDAEETKYLCDYVLDGVDKTNILFKHELVDETTKKPSPPEPLPTFLDILLPKYKNSENLAKIFFKKYQKLRRNKKMVKKARKKALQKLKNAKAKYVQTDDAKTVNNDNDVNIDDLFTVEQNSDTEINLADKRTPLSSVAQQQAKMTIK